MLPDTLFDRPIAQTQLREEFKRACDKYGELAPSDIKKILGATELEIVEQQLGVCSIPLKGRFLTIANSLSSLGYIATRTYNNAAIQECKGFYMATVCNNSVRIIMANAKEAGVQLSLDNWQYIYAVKELSEVGYRYSLQIFARNGRVVQKIFMQPQSNFYAYHDIVNEYKSEKLRYQSKVKKLPIDEHEKINIDVRALIIDWRKNKPIGHVEELVKKYGISYQEIYRYIGDVYAEELSARKLEIIMEQIVERNMSITFHTSNRGVSQYYSGVLDNVYASGDYLYCMAVDFSLRVHETGIANAWLVRKATPQGIVTSLEFYDYYGNQLLKIHGQYDHNYGESIHWKRLAESALQYCSSGYLVGANKSSAAYTA